MPVSAELIGREFPASAPYEVTAERITEFAAATGSTYGGGADDPAPATFPIVVAFRAMTALITDPGVGISLQRVVHGEQRFSYSRPVVSGDVLTATLTVESLRQRGGADFITTSTEITDADAQHVVTARAVIVHRGEE